MEYLFVYILTNNSGTLYVGITNDLERRVSEHRAGVGSQFTGQYALKKLLYYETFSNAEVAITREKQIKRWTRKKKIALFEAGNPGWLNVELMR